MDLTLLSTYEQSGRFNEAIELFDDKTNKPQAELMVRKARILFFLNDTPKSNIILDDIIEKNEANTQVDQETLINALSLKIEILLLTRNFNKIESLINKFEGIMKRSTFKKDVKNSTEYANFILSEAQYRIQTSELDKAENLAKSTISIYKSHKLSKEIGMTSNLLGDVFSAKWKLDDALVKYKESLQKFRELENSYEIGNTLNSIGKIHFRKSNYDQAKVYFDEGITQFEAINNLRGLNLLYNNLGTVYRRKGEKEKAITEYHKSLQISTEIEDFQTVFATHINIGNIHFDSGDLDEALFSYFKAIPLARPETNKSLLALLNSNMGVVFRQRGELNQALGYFDKCLKLYEEASDNQQVAATIHNIGRVYRMKGELGTAIPYFEKSYKLRKENKDKLGMSYDLLELGLIKLEMGIINEATASFEECYKIRRDLDNEMLLTEILNHLIEAYLLINNESKIANYFSILEKIYSKTDNKNSKNHYLIAKTNILLKQEGTRLSQQVEAYELFKEILEAGHIDNEHTVYAMLKLAEYLITELRATKDDELLIEVGTILQEVYDMAQKQESHKLLINVMVAQSKLAYVNEGIKEALDLLNHALNIAENKQLVQHKLEITTEIEKIERNAEKYIGTDFDTSITKLVEHQEIDDYLYKIAQAMNFDFSNEDFITTSGKNLLKANMDFADLIGKDENLSDDMKNYLNFLELSVREFKLLASTYNLILRLSNNAYPSLKSTFDISHLISDRLNVFQEVFENKQINIIDQFNLSNHEINAERYLLTHIMDNLFQNASKFTIHGGIFDIDVNENDEYVIFKFSNECAIIPENVLPTLLNKFTQHLFDRETRKLGVGIGLTFVKLAADFMGDKIDIFSPIPGENNGFRLTYFLNKK